MQVAVESEVRGEPDHVIQFRRDGYAVVRGLFDAKEVAEIAAAFDREYAAGLAHGRSFRHGNLYYRVRKDPVLGPVVRLAQWPSYHDPVLARVRTDKRILNLLEPLLGRDLKQIINQLHWKPPGAKAAEFAFHQDIRFRRPRSAYRNPATSYIQTGIAIDPHQRESGCMRVLPGSHLLGEISLPVEGSVDSNAAAEAGLAAAGLDPGKLVDLELEPGDFAMWGLFTIHGSGPNETKRDRRFYLNGYIRASDCARGEWAFRGGRPCALGWPQLVTYEDLFLRPEPHYPEE